MSKRGTESSTSRQARKSRESQHTKESPKLEQLRDRNGIQAMLKEMTPKGWFQRLCILPVKSWWQLADLKTRVQLIEFTIVQLQKLFDLCHEDKRGDEVEKVWCQIPRILEADGMPPYMQKLSLAIASEVKHYVTVAWPEYTCQALALTRRDPDLGVYVLDCLLRAQEKLGTHSMGTHSTVEAYLAAFPSNPLDTFTDGLGWWPWLDQLEQHVRAFDEEPGLKQTYDHPSAAILDPLQDQKQRIVLSLIELKTAIQTQSGFADFMQLKILTFCVSIFIWFAPYVANLGKEHFYDVTLRHSSNATLELV